MEDEKIRKWEDMPTDCLVHIFGRVKLESRLLDIPLVCKSWFQAVGNPLCWQQLDFPSFFPFLCRGESWFQLKEQSGRNTMVHFVVNLSQRGATSLTLPSWCNRDELIYVSEACPALKSLVLPAFVCLQHSDLILNLIVKWKNLEFLSLGNTSNFLVVGFVELIGNHLPNLNGLHLTSEYIDDNIALAIVSILPKLKYLIINGANFPKETLLIILKGCKELVRLDVRNCIGFEKDDEEISRFSSGIKNYMA